MKKLTFIILFIVAFQCAKAQDTYSDTVHISKTKEQIYSRAKEYFAVNNPDIKQNITLDDKTSGHIIAICDYKKHKQLSVYHIKYTLSVSIKDGVYKYILSDITYNSITVGQKLALDAIKNVMPDFKKFISENSKLDF